MIETHSAIVATPAGEPASQWASSSNSINRSLAIGSSRTSALLVRPQEQIHLSCQIEAVGETDFVYWYKNKEPIQYDQLRSSSSSSGSSNNNEQESPNKQTNRLINRLISNKIPTLKFSQPKKQQTSQNKGLSINQQATTTTMPNKHGDLLWSGSSSLNINSAQLSDTGNYTCAVSSTHPLLYYIIYPIIVGLCRS